MNLIFVLCSLFIYSKFELYTYYIDIFHFQKMKKSYRLFKLFLSLLATLFIPLFSSQAEAQVSHGGRPLPLSILRSTDERLFKEMPAFDLAEELRIDSLCESDLRSGHRFAYKFMTDYSRNNSGISFTLADGTKVWRLGIRSKGACSINLLFSEYELPEGAQLFIYNPQQTHILGAFNHLNNSDLQLLPTRPLPGDELIIEYQEPADAAFHGRLTVGEVNHAYRPLRGAEPKEDQEELSCIPALSCFQNDTITYEQTGRSVVLLIINGNTSCTGVLVNNTAEDGKPYLLTASHCLNGNFSVKNPDYEQIAGTIVTFFNYNSPLCTPKIKGTEEHTVASARFRAADETHDMMLLELLEIPPVHYQPLYAGWNIANLGQPPYTCIQHPKTGTKSLSIEEDKIEYKTMQISQMEFKKEAHLLVKNWETGCTAEGSSGAPLFDSQLQIVGLLTGGGSTCAKPENDFFYSIKKAWDDSNSPDRQLKHWLDPLNQNTQSCKGMDPYGTSPCFRLSNVRTNGKTDKLETAYVGNDKEKGVLFGNNTLKTNEYAEHYQTEGPALLYGAYFVTPATGSNSKELKVKVTVYSGTEQPEKLLHSEQFQPAFCNKVIFNDSFQETAKSLNRSQESYIQFSKPVNVEGNFYIGYQIEEVPENSSFSVFNLSKGASSKNTTWIHQHGSWTEATHYAQALFNTSLFIDPVIQYRQATGNTPILSTSQPQIIQSSHRKSLQILLPDETDNAHYSIISTGGIILESGRLQQPQTTLPTDRYPAGIYLINITFDNKTFVEKMIF